MRALTDRTRANGLAASGKQLSIGLLEASAALLVVAEIVILFVGIIARYAFDNPLIWTDDTASLLFLWLSMVGSVLALLRGEHMRMTALVSRTSPRTRQGLELFSLSAMLALLLALVLPAFEYMQNDAIVSIMSLDISMSWRAVAMPLGILVMAAMLLARILAYPRLPAVVALASVGVAVLTVSLAEPVLADLGQLNLLIFFVGIVAFTVFAGIPIAFSFGLSTIGYLALSSPVPLSVLVERMDTGMSHPELLAVPLFIVLGLLIEMTGMARVMVRFLANLIGHTRGGLSFVLIVAIYLVSGISGSKAADMAAVAPVLFPEMERRGAARGDLVALLAATSAQTETVPPSLILITIGSVTGISIAALFTGGLLPGLVVGLVLCAAVWNRARIIDREVPERAPLTVMVRSLVVALPALALPFLIRGAVVSGVATATEVSTIGIVYAVLVGLCVYRAFDTSEVLPMLVRTASLAGAILLIIGAATAMSWAITQSGFSVVVAGWIATIPGGAVSFMLISIVLFIVLGSILEGIPAIVLFGPLLFPMARSLHINEVHYAMVAILSMGVGLFAPPFGVGYYVACAIGQCNPDDGMPHIWRYLLAVVVGLLIVAAVPWISIGFL
ncbi:MAG: TRAP transporter large permease subunit [Acetobacteraceae bacterium]|nr:TRAP transporter large permease subunit [Acetobacteraceae bacterium]